MMILMITITMRTMIMIIIIFHEVINFLHLRRAYQLPTHLAQLKLWCFRKLINWFTFHDRRERQKYYKHQDKARKMPDRYMSLFTDRMDSSKTNITHFKVKSKVSLFRHQLRWKATRFRLSGTRAISTLKVPGRVILCFVTCKWIVKNILCDRN